MSLTALLFILLFFVGSSYAIFKDARYGIYLYIINYFLSPRNRWWWGSLPHWRFSFFIGIIVIIAFLVHYSKYSENRAFSVPQTKWFIALCCIMIAVYPFSLNLPLQEEQIILFIKYFLLYVLVIKIIDTTDKHEKLICLFLLGEFYLGWLAYTTGRTGQGRLEGIGPMDAKDSNAVAALLILSIPLIINFLLTGKRWQKFCALPLFVFVLNGLILINSRASYLGIIASLAYYFYKVFKMPGVLKRNKTSLIIGTVGVIVIFFYLADVTFWDRMGTLSNSEDESRGRFYFWGKAFEMVGDYPFGVGIGGYNILSLEYFDGDILGSHSAGGRDVHNTFLAVLVEHGYLGLCLFLIFIFSNLRCLRNIKKVLIERNLVEPYGRAVAFEAGFIAYLVASMTHSNFARESLYFFSAFIASYLNIYTKELKKL